MPNSHPPEFQSHLSLLAKVNEAYGKAARDCNGPAMHILGELHRELILVSEGQGSISDSDALRLVLEILPDIQNIG